MLLSAVPSAALLFSAVSGAVYLALARRQRTRVTLRNWCGNVLFQPSAIHHPATLASLQALVGSAARCKVVGSAHSFNTLACPSGGALISLASLALGAPALDAATGVCWVPGSFRYSELVGFLAGAPWALHNMASLPHITVAGSLATATHGSGVGNGNLASCVVGLELVLADGSLLRASPSTHPEDFAGMVVHLGALGVVTRVALQLVPAFYCRQVCYQGLTLDAAAEHFDAIMSAGYSVSLFTTWREPLFEQCWRKCVCAGPAGAGAMEASEQGLAGLFPAQWHGATRATQDLHPIPGVSAAPCTPQLGLPGHAHHRLPHFRADFTPSAGEELQSEYFVPRAHAPAALRAVAALRASIAPLLHISEIRCVAGDELWLSMAAGRPGGSAALHFTWKREPEGVAALLPALEAALAPFDARPHWGKLASREGSARARLSYAAFAKFQALRQRLDPQGKFLNDHLRLLLGEQVD